jgi:hypothetical protein
MAAPPPPGPPQVGGQPAPILSYRDRYLDNTQDEDRGQTQALLEFFDPMTVPARDPITLRTAASNESDQSTHAYAILQQDPNYPMLLGRVAILHGVKVYPTRVGVPANNWHGRTFAFVHDTLARNDPQTVEFPVDAFHRATGGGVMTTYRPEALQLIFAAAPDQQVTDPPGPMDPGQQQVVARFIQPVPFRFVAGLLHQTWTPRDFFSMVYAEIVANGLQLQCAPLANWMCAACTARANGELISRVGHVTVTVPLADTSLREHRHQLVLAQLPALSLAPTTVGASQIANSLGEVVQQLRGVRQDASNRSDASTSKSPQEHYGPTLDVWMQLAHVASEANLQPVHTALASNGKKQTRSTWEQHVSRAALAERYVGIRVVVPPAVAEKLNRCDWFSYDPDNLSTGINCYQLGGSTRENLASFEEIARTHDLALLTGSGDLSQIHQVVNDKTIDIPRTYHQAQTQLKGFRLLLLVAFGGTHTTTLALEQFIQSMSAYMEMLYNYKPHAPDHEVLGPALVCQQFRMHFNVWAARQMASPTPVAFPNGVHDMWDQILLGDPSWEKPIPYTYLRLYRPDPTPYSPAVDRGPGGGGGAPAPAPGPAPSPAPAAGPRQSVHRNTWPNAAYEEYARAKGDRTLKDLIIQAGDALPKNDRGQEMCLTFHLLGSCNSRCKRRKDHHDIEGGKRHTPDEDAKLLSWCSRPITAE